METNPYEYDRVPWIAQQNKIYEGRYVVGRTAQQPASLQSQRLQERGGGQKPKVAGRMPKAQVLALVRSFKKWLIVASFVSFGTFSGLAAFHQMDTTANQVSQTSQASSGSSQAASNTSSQDNNNFFNQQGGNNFGSNNSSNGSSTTSQAPVTGSGVS